MAHLCVIIKPLYDDYGVYIWFTLS